MAELHHDQAIVKGPIRWNLRRLILILATVGSLLILANGLLASYSVQRQTVIDNTLEANRAYAAKVADDIDSFLRSAAQQLGYSAALLSNQFDRSTVLNAEATRLSRQTDSFNTVVFVDHGGWVLATSPGSPQGVGSRMDSFGSDEALQRREPLITAPYVSSAGNLLVFISYPVVEPGGRYRGFIGGTIYLKQQSILNRLIGEHYHRDGSYLYVVDRSRRLLAHPESERIGTVVGENRIIDSVLAGSSGVMQAVNSRGIDMLAGYAPVPKAGWGVVVQRPTEDTLRVLESLMLDVLIRTLPLTFLTLFLIWWVSRKISQPLQQLASNARVMDRQETPERIARLSSWYFEASELKRAMLVGVNLFQSAIGQLQRDAQTDTLTGLLNRRSLHLTLTLWESEGRPFAAIALDIDHFKRVNDTFGHEAGDRVLQALANLMKDESRKTDLLFRVGGEEFLMLLPDIDAETAAHAADRLRQRVAAAEMPVVGNITISLGVAHWPQQVVSVAELLRRADQMLYRAKQRGRDRVEVADNLEETSPTGPAR